VATRSAGRSSDEDHEQGLRSGRHWPTRAREGPAPQEYGPGVTHARDPPVQGTSALATRSASPRRGMRWPARARAWGLTYARDPLVQGTGQQGHGPGFDLRQGPLHIGDEECESARGDEERQRTWRRGAPAPPADGHSGPPSAAPQDDRADLRAPTTAHFCSQAESVRQRRGPQSPLTLLCRASNRWHGQQGPEPTERTDRQTDGQTDRRRRREQPQQQQQPPRGSESTAPLGGTQL